MVETHKSKVASLRYLLIDLSRRHTAADEDLLSSLQIVKDCGYRHEVINEFCLWHMLQDAKTDLRDACNRSKTIYAPVIKIIEKKSKDGLDTYYLLAVYLLDSFYLYKDTLHITIPLPGLP